MGIGTNFVFSHYPVFFLDSDYLIKYKLYLYIHFKDFHTFNRYITLFEIIRFINGYKYHWKCQTINE